MTKKNTDTSKKTKMKKKYTKNMICVIICFILLFITLGFLLYRWSRPFYKVESRVEEVKKKDKEIDREVTGWIRVQGTNIDYPIIYADGEEIAKGYAYAWSNQETANVNSRKILLGHNVLNLAANPQKTGVKYSGFEELLSFLYPDFLKDNKYIQYTVDGKDYMYKIFAVTFIKSSEGDIYDNYMNDKELSEYVKKAKEDSYFDFDVDVNDNDGIITLATCTRIFGPVAGYSFRIDGRLVRNGEIMSNYGFKKTKNYSNYNKVKEKEKGDETNEKA